LGRRRATSYGHADGVNRNGWSIWNVLLIFQVKKCGRTEKFKFKTRNN
jgi:hypothetical protein